MAMEKKSEVVTRRTFLKGAAVGGIVGAAVSAGVATVPIITAPPAQRTVSGDSDSVTMIVSTIADKTVDLDGDKKDDLRITTRLQASRYTGLMEGTHTSVQTITEDLQTHIARATTIATFSGRVGGSEPGVMAMIHTMISDRSNPNLYKTQGRVVVVEGSGMGGLEGISGGGSTQTEGPPAGPFKGTRHYEFRFPK